VSPISKEGPLDVALYPEQIAGQLALGPEPL
jgi:hypothetical protein